MYLKLSAYIYADLGIVKLVRLKLPITYAVGQYSTPQK